MNGDGLLQDVHRSGFYSIRYGFGVPFQGTLTTIIDTDYDDYAVVYSCTNSLLSGVFHSEYIWVLSRSGKISNPTRQNIYEKLDKLQINRSGLTMSDRSTCPTNSSTVARESDKDLAGVQNGLNAGNKEASGSGSGSSSAGGELAAAGSASSSPSANLEKASAAQSEPIQKSVVVPLLYDIPSPVSSSSVGGSSKPNPAKAPPAPVENKVPQLPLSSSLSSGQLLKQQQVGAQAASASKPLAQSQAQQSPVPASSGGSIAGATSNAAASPAQPGAGNSKPAIVQQAPSQSQQQSSGLLAKIQPKP